MDKVKQEFTLKCQKHAQFNVEFLKINNLSKNSNQSPFYCCECLDDDNEISQKDCLLIQKIIDQGENSIIPKWPPLNDPKLLENLRGINHITSYDSQEGVINDFFNNFTQEVISVIQNCRKNLLKIVEQLPQKDIVFLENYQKISKICELRQILINQDYSYADKERNCKEIINQQDKDRAKNTQILENIYEISRSSQKINLDYFQHIQSSVISLIDSINAYPFQQFDNKEIQKVFNTDLKIEALTQTISQITQLNSDESINSIKGISKIIQPLIEQYMIKERIKKKAESNSVLSNYQFSQTDYQKSSNTFTFTRNYNQEIIVSAEKTSSLYAQCSLNCPLDKQKQYVFRFKISVEKEALFLIGLVRNSQKDIYCGREDLLGSYFKLIQGKIAYDENNCYGFNKIQNGQSFSIDHNKQQLELRISFKDSILKFTDYPEYSNSLSICEQSKKNLKEFEDLRLFLFFGNNTTKIILTEILCGQYLF